MPGIAERRIFRQRVIFENGAKTVNIDDIKGVGEATAERLRSAGVEDVQDLAESDPAKLSESGLSEQKAQKLISRAKRQTVVLQSGEKAREEAEAKDYITTGMEALDDLLGGGYREGHIAGISGEASSGKTQLVFRALGAAVEQTDDPVVYIETERERFDASRIAALSDLSLDEIEENVWRAKAYSLDQQREAYQAITDSFDSIALVVVDSFTSRFRLSEKFEGRTSLTDRNAAFVRHLNGIENMVDTLDCPALLTLQIMGNPQRFGGSEATWGGSLMDHTITYQLKMSHAQGQFRKAELSGHPSQGEGEVLITIGEDGMEAHQE